MRHAIKKNKKNVADGGSTVPLACCNMGLMKRSTGLITHKENTLKNMHKKARCLFCGHRGKIVIKFPRRGYGRRRKS